MTADKNTEINDLRIDKWLWAARFFKTRGLAVEAIKGGKIDVNGQRSKPARAVHINDQIKIRKSPFIYEVIVKALSKHRGPASEACKLYEESDHSITRRKEIAEQIRAEAATHPTYPGRPSKRDRRNIIRFTRKGNS